MEIISIGIQLHQQSLRDVQDAGRRIVEDGPEVDDVVELKLAEEAARMGAALIKKGDDIAGTLLDIIA